MGTQTFKAALNAAQFPISYRQASRSVLQNSADVANRVPGQFSGAPDNIDYNVIQLLLAENILPIARGLQSVSYTEIYAAYDPPATDFDQLIFIQEGSGYTASFCPARGKNYVLTPENPVWTSYAPFVLSADLFLVTKGYVAGRTLIFYERTKCVEWNSGTIALDTLTLILPGGYTLADIRGNSAASNYHLLFTDTEILWSTPQNPLDFADIVQGAGRQIPIDIRGKITAVVPISGGFLICTTQNIIGASFTGDTSRPFMFREVLSSAGIEGPEHITDDSNALGHYAYGNGGIQQITLQRAESVFSEVSDFLVSRYLDYWDTTTKTVLSLVRAFDVTAKVRFLGARYFAISYGVNKGHYEFVLIFDTSLQRWGKLRIDHVDCDNLPLAEGGTYLQYQDLVGSYDDQGTTAYADLRSGQVPLKYLRQDFGFLRPDGTTYILAVDSTDGTDYGAGGVVIFGHMQVRRDKNITVLSADLDGVAPIPEPSVTLLGSESGYTRTESHPMEVTEVEENFLRYDARYTARNIDIAVEGSMNLTNLVVETVIHGSR
jgi:hypothetical protein